MDKAVKADKGRALGRGKERKVKKKTYTGLIPAYSDFTSTCLGPGEGFSMSETSSKDAPTLARRRPFILLSLGDFSF